MGALGWVAVGLGVVCALGVLAWLMLLATSFRVEPGTVVLLLKQGRATGRVVGPGRHFIQPWRKVLVQVYPARELALVAGGPASSDERVDHLDAALRVYLADKVLARLSYTVRCRLDPSKVQLVHDRFGAEGIWPVIRDTTRRCLVAEAASASVDGVFGDEFAAFEERCATALRAGLATVGFELVVFTLREIDLGETGEVIQATMRADLELELEQALARVRQVRLDNDAAMAETLAGLDSQVLLRYRQLESWREILRRGDGGQMVPAALAAMLVSGQPGDGSGWTGSDGTGTGPGGGDTP
jgi:regulator of protease activity HflC (stomatin/prohibitin superfamily)